jgi:hypothetical protein
MSDAECIVAASWNRTEQIGIAIVLQAKADEEEK